MMTHRMRYAATLVTFLVCLLTTCSTHADLYVGSASTEITPEQPVIVTGQFALRVSQKTETPLTANVIVVESRSHSSSHSSTDSSSEDYAIMVSCDVICIPVSVLEQVRTQVAKQLPDLDTKKIFLGGTHTHTAPELRRGMWMRPEGVMPVEEYRDFFARRVADAIVEAWKQRAPGSISWGLSHAAVAYNRRAVYADGSSKMYGSTSVPEFRGLEGYEDHDVGSLFVWNTTGELIAVAINVACPSQEVEGRSTLNADFWHPVRQQLRAKYGAQLCILGWTGAAGDQSPHLMYRNAADERMRRLRGLSRLEEIARRVVAAVNDSYDVVQNDRHSNLPVVHKLESMRLPMRVVKEDEYQEAKQNVEQALAKMKEDPNSSASLYRRMKWYEATVTRYEDQQADPHQEFELELHVVRIGDIVICTNPFELFTDYGIRIKARSKAVQTFVIQLVGPGTYLPTEKAVRGGHYSAIVHSSHVGPEGGQIFVDRTIALIHSLWP